MNSFMRIMVFFDLPVDEKEKRRRYKQFHNFLEKDGYDMMQFSIYSRICNGLDSVEKHMKRLQWSIPEEGHIRAMVITERQYENMYLLLGKKSRREKLINSEQLQIF